MEHDLVPTNLSSQFKTTAVRAWVTLACLSMLQFLIAVDVTVVNVALPSIGAEFGANARQLTWVVVGYTITGGGLLMLGGRLGDLLGQRRLLMIGTTVFGLASLLAGLAPTYPILVTARLLQGAGEAMALPAAMAVIVLLFPEGRGRSRALSVWAAVASCGLVLGFILSGVITEFLGWRWIFLVSVPFIVFVLIASGILIPADQPRRRMKLDLPGSVLLTAAPLLLVFGIVEAGETDGIPRWAAVVVLIGAVIAAYMFVVVERRATNPLIPLEFFRNRTRVGANLATALLSGALSTSFLLFTFYLQNRLGLSPLTTGLTLVPLAISLVAAATLVPRFLGRWGARFCAVTGIGFTALGMVAIAIVTYVEAAAIAMIPAMVLIAVGMGFGLVGLQYAAVTGVTESDAGTASGVQRAADQLGGSAGITLYIGLGFSGASFGIDPFLLSSAFAIIGLIGAGLIAMRISMPRHGAEEYA